MTVGTAWYDWAMVSAPASVLLLIDVQRNMLAPPDPVPGADSVYATIQDLLGRARSLGAAVVHVRNNGPVGGPDAPGTPGWELMIDPGPGEPVIDKTHQNAFAGTELAAALPAGASLLLAGMQTEYCVRSTALAALDRGHTVTLVRGGHATYDDDTPAQETVHRIETELIGRGVRLAQLDEVTFGPQA